MPSQEWFHYVEAPCASHRLHEKNVLQNVKNHPLVLQNAYFANGADRWRRIWKVFLSQTVPHLTHSLHTGGRPPKLC